MDETHWSYIENMDAGGLRELMAQYGSEVWNLAFVLTKRRELADDISQDVFLAAYRKIDTFRGASSVRTWLLSITRNTALNRLRSAFMRRVTLMDRIDARAHEACPSAESEALRRSLSNEIWEDVMRLPLKLREALVLQARYELTVKEIREQTRNEKSAVHAGQVTDRMYEQSRFDIGGLDYSGWEKKFLPLSSGTYFFDDSLGRQGFIQSLTQPAREYAVPDVIKLSSAIIFTTDDLAYATPDGIQVGLTQAEVMGKLGLPNARTETEWSYRIGDALRFRLLFEDGKVRFMSLTKPG